MTAHHQTLGAGDRTRQTDAPSPVPALRPARAEDVPAILEVVQAAYRGEGGWTTEAHLVRGARAEEAEIAAMLTDPAVSLLVADSDGQVLGCCYTRTEADADGGRGAGQNARAELGLFAVDPAAQGRGLGSRLLEAQASRLADAGVAVLVIQVLQGRPELHAWYERHGFTRTGTTAPFPGDPGDLTVAGLGMEIMERPLRAR